MFKISLVINLLYRSYIFDITNELKKGIDKMVKGLVMNPKELKKLVVFFRSQGISPTVKELCSTNMYLGYFNYKKVS
jgi:hypothetical protein